MGLVSTLVGYSQSTVKGIVRGENNEPIEGATLVYRKDITIGAQTDANGAYELFLPSGAVKIVVRFSGMRNDTLSLNLVPNEVLEMNVTLKPLFSIAKIDTRFFKSGTYNTSLDVWFDLDLSEE